MMADNTQGNVPKEEQILSWNNDTQAWTYTVCYHSQCEMKVILIQLGEVPGI